MEFSSILFGSNYNANQIFWANGLWKGLTKYTMNIIIKIYFQFFDGLLIVQFERIFINVITLRYNLTSLSFSFSCRGLRKLEIFVCTCFVGGKVRFPKYFWTLVCVAIFKTSKYIRTQHSRHAFWSTFEYSNIRMRQFPKVNYLEF